VVDESIGAERVDMKQALPLKLSHVIQL